MSVHILWLCFSFCGTLLAWPGPQRCGAGISGRLCGGAALGPGGDLLLAVGCCRGVGSASLAAVVWALAPSCGCLSPLCCPPGSVAVFWARVGSAALRYPPDLSLCSGGGRGPGSSQVHRDRFCRCVAFSPCSCHLAAWCDIPWCPPRGVTPMVLWCRVVSECCFLARADVCAGHGMGCPGELSSVDGRCGRGSAGGCPPVGDIAGINRQEGLVRRV